MAGLHETGIVSGTKDKDYNLIAYVQSCLKNAVRMQVYRADAERDGDGELVELFTKAQADSRKGAEIGKKLLTARLVAGTAPSQTMGDGTAESGQTPATDVMAPNQGEAE
jgi:hypothetical protein